jgi:hypothetical protein
MPKKKKIEYDVIYLGIYEIGEPAVFIGVPPGSTVKEILDKAGKSYHRSDGELKRIRDVSELKPQPYLSLDDIFEEQHGALFLGEHAPLDKQLTQVDDEK